MTDSAPQYFKPALALYPKQKMNYKRTVTKQNKQNYVCTTKLQTLTKHTCDNRRQKCDKHLPKAVLL